MAKLKIVNNYNPKEYGALCDSCPANKGKPVHPINNGTWGVLGEYPGFWEEKKGRPFAGDSGVIHAKATTLGQLPYNEYMDNVVACRTDGLTKDQRAEAVKCCTPRAIKMLPKDIPIILYGTTALQVALGEKQVNVNDYMGVPIWSDILQRVCLPVISPLAATRNRTPALEQIVLEHVSRMLLVIQDRYPTWVWPDVINNLEYSDAECMEALLLLENEEYLGLDVETPRIGRNDEFEIKAKSLYNVGFASLSGKVVALDWLHASSELQQVAIRIIENPRIKKVMQNGSFDYRVFLINGIRVAGFVCDTLHAFRLAYPTVPADLGTIASYLTLAPRWKDEFHRGDAIEKVISFTRESLSKINTHWNIGISSESGFQDIDTGTEPDSEEVRETTGDAFTNADPLSRAVYNGRDAYMQCLLWFIIKKKLEQIHRGPERYATRMKCNDISLRMWEHGIGFSREVQKRLTIPAEKKLGALIIDLREIAAEAGYKHRTIKEYKRKASKIIDIPFNPNSNVHIKKLYLDTWGIQPLEYSENTGEPKYDASVLEAYCEHPNKQVAIFSRLLKNYREEAKLFGTYIKRPPVWLDNRLHPVWKAQHANTLRFGSEGPNAQNIPDILRQLLVKKYKYNWLVSADYSALEFRIVVMLSKDDEFQQMIYTGADIHRHNAAMIFKCSLGKVTELMRAFAKTLLYAILYDASIDTIHARFLAQEMFKDVERDTIVQAVKTIMEGHPKMRRWQLDCVTNAKKNDRVIEPYTGHVLECYGQVDHNLVINFGVQTRASGYTNRALMLIDAELDWTMEFIDGHQHDSLWLEGQDPLRLQNLLETHMPLEDNHEGFKMIYPVETKMSYSDYHNMLKVKPDGSFDIKCKPGDYEKVKQKYIQSLGGANRFYQEVLNSSR